MKKVLSTLVVAFVTIAFAGVVLATVPSDPSAPTGNVKEEKKDEKKDGQKPAEKDQKTEKNEENKPVGASSAPVTK